MSSHNEKLGDIGTGGTLPPSPEQNDSTENKSVENPKWVEEFGSVGTGSTPPPSEDELPPGIINSKPDHLD